MKIEKIFEEFHALLPENEAYEGYREDVVLKGNPEAVLRPKDKFELQRIIKLCAQHEIPFTACGSQTSVTGASVAQRGILISMEKFKDFETPRDRADGTATVKAQPGVLLGDFQQEMEAQGWHYPPDPTSWEEVQLGVSIATNATGENSFYYGSSRNYVLGLEIILPNGDLKSLRRQRNPLELSREKNRAGYLLGEEEIDEWIGSEGSLGIITETELLLLKKPKPFTSVFLFFRHEQEALKFSLKLNDQRTNFNLRCLEYMDHEATKMMRVKSERLTIPEDTCTIYIKLEEICEGFFENCLDNLMEVNSSVTTQSDDLFEEALVAQDRNELLEFRRLRHHVPATINENAYEQRPSGGGKVSSDWWVPLPHLLEQFQYIRDELKNLSIPVVAFGHIGNGHPHVNLIPSNSEEKDAALDFTKKCMQRAARLGGGVCGEHGLGKIKHWALDIQWDSQIVKGMRAVKDKWDPKGLAAPGNLFEDQN